MNENGGLFAAVAGTGLAYGFGGPDRSSDGRGMSAHAASSDTAELVAALPGVSLRRIPRYARMALLAAVRALDDAGWRRAPDMCDIALVIGTAYGGAQMSMDFMDSILDAGPRLSSPTAFSHAVNNMGAGLLSLLLGLQGPCLTVSQFALSFAGAVCGATTLLHAGRAQRVLVGAVDEMDERFTRCCPQIQKAGISQTEGGVFLCLESPDPARPVLRVRWEQSEHAFCPVLASTSAQNDENEACRHEKPPERGPLAQALDTLFALRELREGMTTRVDCPCIAAGGKRTAVIEIWSPQP